MRFTTVQDWLAWQERLHPSGIELGLDRVGKVADAMGLRPPAHRTITVAGTNGKGSCVALLSALLGVSGHRVGSYTSPHLSRYHERIVVDGEEIGDDALCVAFDAVDRARGDVALTYFEFGTLAALHHFRASECDVVVLEVGMGGRLDATNILDADAALVVSIGLDHMEWLGDDREAIGYEKAGIFRAGRPAICADPEPPASVLAEAERLNAHWLHVGDQYRWQRDGDRWAFAGPRLTYSALPLPALPGPSIQLGNAAAALAVLDALPGLFPGDAETVARGLGAVRLRARMERVRPRPEVVVDVTHNPDGARVLARELAARPVPGRTIAVCAMLADKAVCETLRALDAAVDHWVFAGLPGPRGREAAWMSEQAEVADLRGTSERAVDVSAAVVRALTLAGDDDRVLVFGSFLTAGAALDHFDSRP